MAIRFNEKDVREMGRTAAGVRGIKLGKDDNVIGCIVVEELQPYWLLPKKDMENVATLTITELPAQRRQGNYLPLKPANRTEILIAVMEVIDSDELMIISRRRNGYSSKP